MVSFDRMLASDAERTAIVERLQKAAADGRLSLGELSYRASRAFAARTWAELDRLVVDLPPSWGPPQATPTAASQPDYRPFLTLGIGVLAVPVGLLLPGGALLGVIGALVGALTLYDGELPTKERQITVAGILCSLLVVACALVV
jgi:uncharacterized protein DUF1707